MKNILKQVEKEYLAMPGLEGYKKIEKIDGVIYEMSPSAPICHGIINGNIYTAISNHLKDSVCRVFMENLDFYLGEDEWLVPDIIIVCDPHDIKNGRYRGTPKFILEILSPSTAKRDRTLKKRKYETAGVEELWLIEPKGKSLEIYYLEDGKYELEDTWLLEEDREDEDYNADIRIKLRGLPHISMTLADIFENSEWGSGN
ncbi:MAG: Uma2 family endonuclease [Lachnospiraceae bacterium]|nr:Uma2 family endonuclease [Lachnospiraceae bacterium]